MLPSSETTRKPRKERVFQPDEINSKSYKKKLFIKVFSSVNEALLKSLDEGYDITKQIDINF